MNHYGDYYEQDRTERRSELLREIEDLLHETMYSEQCLMIIKGLLQNEDILDGYVGFVNLMKGLK